MSCKLIVTSRVQLLDSDSGERIDTGLRKAILSFGSDLEHLAGKLTATSSPQEFPYGALSLPPTLYIVCALFLNLSTTTKVVVEDSGGTLEYVSVPPGGLALWTPDTAQTASGIYYVRSGADDAPFLFWFFGA